MNAQDEINELLDEFANEILDYTIRESDVIISRIDRIRLQINGILSDYAKNDGTISKHRINTLLRELDEIEYEISEEFYSSVEQAISRVSEQAEKNVTGALIAVLGVALVFGGRSRRPPQENIVSEISDYVFNREGKDGIVLSDRIASVVGFLRDNIQREIRYGVLRGESVNRISRRIISVFEQTSWQFKRIVTTEIPTALRKGIATIGGKTNVVKAIKIYDTPGRIAHPGRHHHHECYRLAEQDMYGMGKGVYLPKDTFILDPHPQCTAYFRFILKEDFANVNE